MNNLEEFHLSCKKEYLKILDKFNILFYGFGNKSNILNKIFVKSLIFDMNYYTINDVIFFLNDKYKLKCKKMTDFNEFIKKRDIYTKNLSWCKINSTISNDKLQ